MFTVSPTGIVLNYEQPTPSSLIGRAPAPVAAYRVLPGQVFETNAPVKQSLAISGDQGTVEGVFDVSTAGTARPIFTLTGGFGFSSAYIKAWLDTSNRLIARITDYAGTTVATSAVTTAVASGCPLVFRLSWHCGGLLPDSFKTNFGGACIEINGTKPNWTVVSSTWTAWSTSQITVGFEDGNVNAFNGTVHRLALGVSSNPQTR